MPEENEVVDKAPEDIVPAVRAIEIGKSLEQLITSMNGIEEFELLELLRLTRIKETLPPKIAPERYKEEIDSLRQSKTFLQALLEFKRAVKGIGRCK